MQKRADELQEGDLIPCSQDGSHKIESVEWNEGNWLIVWFDHCSHHHLYYRSEMVEVMNER
jgi:hypothetical protein